MTLRSIDGWVSELSQYREQLASELARVDGALTAFGERSISAAAVASVATRAPERPAAPKAARGSAAGPASASTRRAPARAAAPAEPAKAGSGGGDSTNRTYDLLRSVFKDNAKQTFDAQQAEQALRARGWQTDAGDPVNAIRSALSRLVQWNEIERVDRGRYALAKPKRRSRGESATAQREDTPAAPETAQSASA